MDPAQVVDQLYVLDPSEFTAARDGRAAEARKAGDRAAAADIKALRRPSPAAWAVNLLAHERADELSRLIELGARLRQAQASLSAEDMRDLSRQRQEIVSALARQARQLVSERGRPISDAGSRQIEDTLVAAVADPDAAAAVATGRLERALDYTGLGPVDLEKAVAGPPAPPTAPGRDPTATPTRRPDENASKNAGDELAIATREAREATAALAESQASLDVASAELAEAERQHADAEDRVAQLQQELAEAGRAVVDTKARTRGITRSRDRAQSAVAAAERRARQAAERLRQRPQSS